MLTQYIIIFVVCGVTVDGQGEQSDTTKEVASVHGTLELIQHNRHVPPEAFLTLFSDSGKTKEANNVILSTDVPRTITSDSKEEETEPTVTGHRLSDKPDDNNATKLNIYAETHTVSTSRGTLTLFNIASMSFVFLCMFH